MSTHDSFVQRFFFEALDIRGAFVQLNDVWREMQRDRAYAPRVRDVLGELAAISAIMTGNLKQPGRLTFQLQGNGRLKLLVVDCTEALNLRGYAKADETLSTASEAALLGSGRLLLTLDAPGLQQPYQSFVPLEGDTIAAIFQHYLVQSEQQPAALWLSANAHGAAGLFLQKLPDADRRDPDGWSRINQLADTVSGDELRTLDATTLLTRLFHEEEVRVFEARPVVHRWPVDPEKIDTMLRSLGRAEVESILAAEGVVEIHDDLSNHTYRYDADAVRKLFEETAVPPLRH
ncbi:Hsp33 family molecular chaperone HslO [Nitrosomonas mobilis]|uniref:33 kDa chaperonin n=1 Tax=Nitrosomonas mobilis TaxID=51642 RepID=A0A1G5SGD4_9PROT|nr:Hsp33 family molecular chaperone HslO [Nitrosomonas mobilis]SCZ86172.1 33 kDa chaperonin [Nitrosomonas mobilis]HNO75667.1 Hsp33 family molecular chaperone HslO [Nitrosomonas mobilis]